MKLLLHPVLTRRAAIQPAIPPESVNQAYYARRQAIAAEEKASLPYPCETGCGARAWELCRSGTGLPASAPCPGRLRDGMGATA